MVHKRMSFLGVDVGGPRKGFDVALVDDGALLWLGRRLTVADVVALAERDRPAVVGIDSPRSCARDGETSRPDERALVRAKVCGIRWTPDAARVHRSGYYGWVVEGLRLHRALEPLGVEVVEVFPTAAWTRWHGPRGTRRRSDWSRAALVAVDLDGVPELTSQDARDAIAAAVTAREHAAGRTERFGEIVVPRGYQARGAPDGGSLIRSPSRTRPSGSSPAGAAPRAAPPPPRPARPSRPSADARTA